MEAHVYCKCGGEMEIEAPRVAAEVAVTAFWQVHDGPEHGDTDASRCRRARTLAERREMGWDPKDIGRST